VDDDQRNLTLAFDAHTLRNHRAPGSAETLELLERADKGREFGSREHGAEFFFVLGNPQFALSQGALP
jgi:hypothetical protein